MAQVSQINIDNQAFATFRSKLNESFTALNSLHSGTSRPGSATTGTLWLDTTNASSNSLTIKFFDGSDDITFATVNTSSNTINFTDSALDVVTDTTPQLGGNLDVNGKQIVSVSNGNIVIMPNGSGKVGVGISSPEQPLHIQSDGGVRVERFNTSAGSANLDLRKSRNATVGSHTILQNGDGIGAVIFRGSDGSQFINSASVSAQVDGTPGTNDMPARLTFSTTADGANAFTERMRIDSSGKVGIGTSSPTGALDVKSGTQPQLKVATASATADRNAGFLVTASNSATAGSRSVVVSLDADGGDGSGTDNLTITKTGGGGNATITNQNNAGLVFGANNAEIMRLTGGKAVIGKTTVDSEIANLMLFGSSPGTASAGQLGIQGSETTGAINTGAGIAFKGHNGGGNRNFGDLKCQKENGSSGDNLSYMSFSTRNASGVAERLRISSSGNVGIGGTPSSTQRLIVNGDGSSIIGGVEFRNASAGGSTASIGMASGTSNSLSIAVNDASNIVFKNTGGTERMRISSAGKVGIGTSSPSTKLTINEGGEPPAEGMLLLQANSSSRQLRIQPPTNSDNGFIDFRGGNLAFLDDGTEVARFQSGGKFGIGTSSPSFEFEVKDASGASVIRVNNGADNKIVDLIADSTGGLLRTVGSYPLVLNTNQTERMRILSDGKVGIGTSSPANTLDVNSSSGGVIKITRDSQSSYLQLSTSGSDAQVFSGAGALKFKTGSSEAARFDTSGRLLIKTTDIGYSGFGDTLTIGSASGNNGMTLRSGTSNYGTFYFSDDTGTSAGTYAGKIQYYHSNNSMVFATNSSSESMRITSAGNVGIGITDPGSNAVNITVADTRVTSGRVLDVHHTKTDTTFTGQVARIQSARNTTNGSYEFIRCAISGVANKFIVTDGGTIQAVNTTVASISDERIKQDIVDAKSQWNDIKALKFKNFKKKQAVRDDGDNALKELGVIAQDVESAGMNGLIEMSNPDISSIKSDSSFGTLWTEDDEEVKNGTETVGEVKEIKEQVKTVKYSMIWMKSVKALQEAMERIESLEAELTALKNQP